MRRAWFLALLTALPAPALAWDGTGHMMVAAVAYDRLTPAARSKADALLRRNPDYASWVANVAPADRARAAFVHAATWPDDIKGRHGYIAASEDPNAPAAMRITGYADRQEHREWHYVDIAFSPDGKRVNPPPKANAQAMIVAMRGVLATADRTADARSYSLVWLLHLVGDIHQPLHAAERVTAEMPDGDRGGNSVHVCTTSCGHNLHAVWDDILGQNLSMDAVLAKAKALPAAPAPAAAKTDPAAWAQESNALARSVVYAPPVQAEGQNFQLDMAYLQRAEAVAQSQVALAGARLALLLNTALR
ncbi:S1/P1 nuclease [Paracraurococcus lichenis]|uniref:S1/P1 nuclease n=1 Tax=Paracraurococcus lichenis TaxID=3064888 RepID=A0ABT9DSG0_9PROT|nr:S1/P1 nuclease [Paracraurococcus sp. LOR1-02]MDO9706835.1 S1/P1 nuclease [Paracraurococcus sp. LOR1-02]